MKQIGTSLSGGSCTFTVWAPFHETVEVIILSPVKLTVPMIYDSLGYWTATVGNISPGALYQFRLDGSLVRPDPASRSQPKGILGPSEVKEPGKFRWTDTSWKNIPLESMIFYELHTGTFSREGSFEGVIRRLDYLHDLGINTIELMPVGQFPGKRNWGYDIAYPFAVQNSYGGQEGLMQLIDSCHSAGFAVIIDVIYNHLGPKGNFLEDFGPYFTDNYKTPWGRAINFDDQYADGVRNYVLQNAEMWFEDYHTDGLRLDAVHAIYDFSAMHIMQELAEEVGKINKTSGHKHYLIAESALNDSRYITDIQHGGYGLDAQWNDDFHHGLHALVTGENNGYYVDFSEPDTLLKALSNGYAFDGQYSEYRKRRFGNSCAGNPGRQFVIFSQNHDQTGNRKFGERLSMLVSFEMLKVIAGAIFISPYLPLLFMGEEYGERNPFLYFVDHQDKELNELVRIGRQNEFRNFYSDDDIPAPDPSDPVTFRKSKLTADPLSDKNSEKLFSYYKTLIGLRKEHPVLKDLNRKNMRAVRNNGLFTIERWNDEGRIFACLNFSNKPEEIHLPDGFAGKAVVLINSSAIEWNGPQRAGFVDNEPGETATINGETLVIYSLQNS